MIELDGISFRRGSREILRTLTWTLPRGEHAVLLGPNGAGKSTLVSLIAARQWPSEGSVTVLGQRYGRVNLREFRRRLGVFQPTDQEGLVHFHPQTTALEVIVTGVDGALAAYREYAASDLERASRLVERLQPDDSLRGLLAQPFRVLSAGERRKVLLLRALVATPELLIVDEPYETLDVGSRLSLERLLANAVAELSVTVLLVLHRAEEIPAFVTRALMLRDGALHAAGRLIDLMHDETVSTLYGVPVHVGAREGRYYWMPKSTPAASVGRGDR